MKINAISIVPQEVGCNAKCKYCIAHLTKEIRQKLRKPGINLPKLEKCIKFANASTAIITSSGETLLGSWTNIENILWLCKKYFGQIDLHTNGLEIINPPEFGKDFSQMIAPYLTNITITVPHYNEKICESHGFIIDYKKLFKKLNDLGIVIRLSCVICRSHFLKYNSLEGLNQVLRDFITSYTKHFANFGVSQIVFRELWIPSLLSSEKTHDWCENNFVSQDLIDNAIRSLPITKQLNLWGNRQPFEFHGVAISSSTCTNNVKSDLIKSVVYRPDNCLYSDWDTKCKIM